MDKPISNIADEIEMSDWPEFSIKSTMSFKEHIIRDDGSVALTTYDTATTIRNNKDFAVHLHPKESSTCSPSLTGTSQMTSLSDANGKAEWGRVDFWDIYYTGDLPNMIEPTCRPPVDGSAYALCSEKDGKTVVICISQMTDNPELAEEIFRTFKWTD